MSIIDRRAAERKACAGCGSAPGVHCHDACPNRREEELPAEVLEAERERLEQGPTSKPPPPSS